MFPYLIYFSPTCGCVHIECVCGGGIFLSPSRTTWDPMACNIPQCVFSKSKAFSTIINDQNPESNKDTLGTWSVEPIHILPIISKTNLPGNNCYLSFIAVSCNGFLISNWSKIAHLSIFFLLLLAIFRRNDSLPWSVSSCLHLVLSWS